MRLQSITLALVGALLVGPAAQAQSDFPSRPVRIIVPYVPGGVVDVTASTLRDFLAERWKQTVVVENRPGGATVTGSNVVATAPPDGHTLLIAANPFLVKPTLQPNLPYDTLRDFTGVSLLVAQSVAMLCACRRCGPQHPRTGRGGEAAAGAVRLWLLGNGGNFPPDRRIAGPHRRDQALAHPVYRRRQGNDRPARWPHSACLRPRAVGAAVRRFG